MMKTIDIRTQRRTEFADITDQVAAAVAESPCADGVATVFVPHTTAGVTINENADPDVTADMAMALDRMIPWEAGYHHGEGNSAAHVKASLMGNAIQIPFEARRLRLGTWQAVYFCEFDGPRQRQAWVRVGA